MKRNIMVWDRTAQVGLGMLVWASPLLELPTYPINLLGLVLIATGGIGYCPHDAILPVSGCHLSMSPRVSLCRSTFDDKRTEVRSDQRAVAIARARSRSLLA
jgi:hypothetical protein